MYDETRRTLLPGLVARTASSIVQRTIKSNVVTVWWVSLKGTGDQPVPFSVPLALEGGSLHVPLASHAVTWWLAFVVGSSFVSASLLFLFIVRPRFSALVSSGRLLAYLLLFLFIVRPRWCT